MGLSVTIKAGETAATSSVQATGSVQHIITDTERESFNIQDSSLKNAVKAYFGKKPNDAYLHSPTPWDDLYKRYGWSQVQVIMRPISSTVTGITSNPTIIATKNFTNSSSHKATFNAGISDQVTDTVESNWSQTNTISVSQSVSYEVGFLGSGGGGETSFSYSREWGEGGSKSTSVTVGSETGVSVDLDPGESIEAVLSASRGKMKVRIVYEAYLTGQTAINYNPRYKGHHFWALPINSVMSSGGLSTTMQFTEDIELDFYSDASIEIRDSKNDRKMLYRMADVAAS